MICHLVNNAAAIGMTLIGSDAARRQQRETTGQMLIAIAIGVVICAICTWLANRIIPRPAPPLGSV
jgi:ABC-type cobalamin transport system permease subunit